MLPLSLLLFGGDIYYVAGAYYYCYYIVKGAGAVAIPYVAGWAGRLDYVVAHIVVADIEQCDFVYAVDECYYMKVHYLVVVVDNIVADFVKVVSYYQAAVAAVPDYDHSLVVVDCDWGAHQADIAAAAADNQEQHYCDDNFLGYANFANCQQNCFLAQTAHDN